MRGYGFGGLLGNLPILIGKAFIPAATSDHQGTHFMLSRGGGESWHDRGSGVRLAGREEFLVDGLITTIPPVTTRSFRMPFYRAAVDLSRATLNYVAG